VIPGPAIEIHAPREDFATNGLAPITNACPATGPSGVCTPFENFGTPISTLFDTGFGAYFLRPLWSMRDSHISVPSSGNSNIRIFADTRDVTHDFVVQPIAAAKLTLFDTPSVVASGVTYTMASSLDQTIGPAANPTAHLNATNQLAFTVANLPELSYDFHLNGLLVGIIALC